MQGRREKTRVFFLARWRTEARSAIGPCLGEARVPAAAGSTPGGEGAMQCLLQVRVCLWRGVLCASGTQEAQAKQAGFFSSSSFFRFLSRWGCARYGVGRQIFFLFLFWNLSPLGWRVV